jgi:hypothetical protein
MSQRGRKSRASLSVVPVIPGARTPAPVELDEAESRIWDAVLRSMRQDWYSPAIAPLLRAYCTECVTAELLERKLRELREFSPSDPYYFRLMTAHRQSAKTLDLVGNEVEAHTAKQSSRRD